MDSRLTLKRGTLFRLPVRGVGMVLAMLLLHACGGGGSTLLPEAGSMRGFVPDLRGRRVMVYPVQIRQSVPGDVDRVGDPLYGQIRRLVVVVRAIAE
jgi:hypothetical protein